MQMLFESNEQHVLFILSWHQSGQEDIGLLEWVNPLQRQYAEQAEHLLFILLFTYICKYKP